MEVKRNQGSWTFLLTSDADVSERAGNFATIEQEKKLTNCFNIYNIFSLLVLINVLIVSKT